MRADAGDAAAGRTGSRRAAAGGPSRLWWWIGGFAVAGIALRLGAAWWIPKQMVWYDLGGDGWVYYLNARALADGEWFVDALILGHPPEAMHPPLWTLVLGGLTKLGLTARFHLQIATAVLGGVTIVLVALLARRVAGPRAAIWAAGLAACYPGFWIYERNLNAEALLFPLLAGLLLVAYRFRDRPSWGSAAAMGLLVGLLAMTRAEQVLLLVLLVVPLVLLTKVLPLARRAAYAALAVGLVVLVSAPWTIFNATRFEQPVLLSAGSGTAMVVGACDGSFYGPHVGGFDGNCLLTSYGQYHPDDAVRSSQQQREALDYTRENLGRFPVVLLAREGRSFGLYEPAQQVQLNVTSQNAPPWLGWAQVVSYWVLLPLAVAGAVLLRRRGALLWPLLVPPVIVAIATAVTFGDSRYRASMELSVIVLAAVAAAVIQTSIAARRFVDVAEPAVGPVAPAEPDLDLTQPVVVDLDAESETDVVPSR